MAGVSVVLVLVAYLGIGTGLAKWDLPRLWNAARHDWSSSDSARESVQMMTLCTVLFWPFRMPWLALWSLTGRAIDRGDPQRLENELREAQQRIAELERDLGIGQ